MSSGKRHTSVDLVTGVQACALPSSAETDFHAQHQLREGGGSFVEHVGGRYVDRLARPSDQWKIIDRTVVFDFISRADSVPNNMDTHGFIFGNRSSEDISYANFSG